MKTIGIFTSGYGHESIAEAIAEKIKQKAGEKYKTKIFLEQKVVLDFFYNSLYRFSPNSFATSYKLTSSLTKKDQLSRKFVEGALLLSDSKKIRSFVKKNKIDLCISTYFLCNPTLEELTKENIPLINILTDPRSTQSLNISDDAVANLIFDEKSAVENYLNIKKSGWFVRDKFEKKYDKNEIRKKLKIDDSLTILVTSGSEGSNTVLKILPSIINCNKKVNFLIACGKNKFLYDNVIGIKQSVENLSSSKAKVIPLGFTKDLQLHMQAADLIVGKAGPNTLFESVACETAFFAITHIHGQEDGNLDIIKDYKIGFVEEDAKKANKKLKNLIEHPEKITAFTENIKALKKYNQNSINILLKEIDNLLEPSKKQKLSRNMN